MENTIYIGLSKQNVLKTNMSIIANNLANMNTPGFRGHNLVFEEFIRGETGQNQVSLVDNPGMYEMTTQGLVKQTGNVLDVALNGPGFIQVIGPDGNPAYTRAGDFQISNNDTLITSGGYEVSTGGGPIAIEPGTQNITIDETGTVVSENGTLGKISIVEFENVQSMEALGQNLYHTDAAGQPATETRLLQGSLEFSNVNPVVEMTRMIEVLRSYQSQARFINNEGERIREAIRTLSKVS